MKRVALPIHNPQVLHSLCTVYLSTSEVLTVVISTFVCMYLLHSICFVCGSPQVHRISTSINKELMHVLCVCVCVLNVFNPCVAMTVVSHSFNTV